MTGTLRRLWCATVLVCAVIACGAALASAALARTLFVRAAASGIGDGSMQRPLGTLSAVENAGRPGDTIVVLPSPSSTAPLDGGIALKAGQKLVGAGPAVAGVNASTPAPRIANSSSAQHSGDAIVLADGVEVSNIAVVGAARGGIYGSDVKDVSVNRNDVTATNTSCTTGFVVQPFILPTSVPGVGVPFSSGLPNGWAAIMVDESHTAAHVSIDGNSVHDANCADGIDIRASGTADITAHVDHNRLTRLRQDPNKSSELAIGMQTTDTSRLVAEVNNNTETYIGTATVGDFGNSDSEGIFENTAGRSRLIEQVDRNTFAHGLGHLSANCVEMAASNGGPTEGMALTNSTCDHVVGDIIEAANLSKDATMTLAIDHVRASHSTYAGSQAQAPVLPGDDGDCLLEVASGSGSTTSVTIKNSQFTDCAADGLGVVSNVVDGTNAAVKKLSFDVKNSRITANQLSNLRVANVTEVQQLEGKIESTDLSRSAGTPVILDNRYGALYNGHTNLDLGGGRLGSTGHNCIYGGAQSDATTLNYNLDAKRNWWGSPNGPMPGRTLATGATIASNPVLTRDTCGPAPLPPRAALSCARPSGRLAGRALGPVTLGIGRAHARGKFLRFTTRGRRDMDFYCLAGGPGIRIGYPSKTLLSSLARSQRARVQTRAILLLTASRYYALDGVRVGRRIAAITSRLRTGAPFQIGLNTWYLAPGQLSTGVLKVRHGLVEEIGIADKRLTADRRAATRFLNSFS